MTTVAIVIALVVVAVTVLLLARGRGAAQLQAPPPPARSLEPATPSSPKKTPSAKKPESSRPPAEADRPRRPFPTGGAAAPEPAVATAPAHEPKSPPVASPAPARSPKDVAGLRKGLAATRGGFIARLTALFQGKKEIDPAILEQLEEVMISSDVGVKTTQAILARLRERLAKNELADSNAVWAALRAEATRILAIGGGAIKASTKPTVVLMVGVNGVGKTTSIGKLATR